MEVWKVQKRTLDEVFAIFVVRSEEPPHVGLFCWIGVAALALHLGGSCARDRRSYNDLAMPVLRYSCIGISLALVSARSRAMGSFPLEPVKACALTAISSEGRKNCCDAAFLGRNIPYGYVLLAGVPGAGMSSGINHTPEQ